MFYIKKDVLNFSETPILNSLPNGTNIVNDLEQFENGTFLEFSKEINFSSTIWSSFTVIKMKRFTALSHRELCWLYPRFGTKEKDFPKRIAVIWIERTDDLKVILIPIIDKGYIMYLKGDKKGLSLIADNNCKYGKECKITGLYVGINKDEFLLMEEAAKNISGFIKIGNLRKNKTLPDWIDKLGYCTWNTFYFFINQVKIIRMLQKFKEIGIIPKYFILDDGWQKVRFFKLLDKGIKLKKFPNGLKRLIDYCKKEFGIKYFLVWHTAQGYWWGINSRGYYGKKFGSSLIQNKPHIGPSYPSEVSWKLKIGKILNNFAAKIGWKNGILLPNKIKDFYEDYYSWLKSQGVDGVKVDNQFGTPIMTYNLGYQAKLMRDYHKNLEKFISKYFSESSVINCMSLNCADLFQYEKTNITRNSMDYFPKKKKEQINHILNNAYNNYWSGQFIHPDWDMFQTANKIGWGEYQAAARAISGSPIYVSEPFEKVNKSILSKVSLPDGTILRCKDIALPCKDCLFTNPAKKGRALKIFNNNEYNSVLGIFNVMLKNPTEVKFSPSDIKGFNDGKYAVYEFNSKILRIMDANQYARIKLKVKGFEIITIAQIQNRFAPIGILTMYNSGGIFKKIVIDKSKISIYLKNYGLIGFFLENKPNKILVNKKVSKFDYSLKTKLLKVFIPQENSYLIEIIM
ncbi:MAG: Sip1-related alpha-galactosidase [Promethearchaeota archaeon]